MAKEDKKGAVFTVTLLLGIFLQVIFVWAGNTDTPSRAAIEFSKAYFRLDPSMTNRLCSEITDAEDTDVVGTYIYQAQKEADARGFGLSFMKKSFDHIHTKRIVQDGDTAVVHVTGITRTCIHPIFAWVAQLFRLGETYEVDEEIHLVREADRWKVCGAPFSLPVEV